MKFGSAPSDESWREAFLTFDIAALGGNVTTAKVRLFGRLSDNLGANLPCGIFAVPNTGWSESTVSFLTRPVSAGAQLSSVSITDNIARWYEWDVASHVATAVAAGATSVSFVLRSLASQVPFMTFASSEASSNQPQLVVTAIVSVATIVQPKATLKLNGISNYLSIPNTPAHAFGPFTAEAWVQPQSLVADHGLLCKGSGTDAATTQYAIALFNQGSAGAYRIGLFVRDAWVYSDAVVLDSGLWQHIAVSYSGADGSRIAFYMDGKAVGTATRSQGIYRNNPSSVAAPLEIGRLAGLGKYFNGYLDEIKLWNRVRTLEEMQTDLNLLLEEPETINGLVGYYKIDGSAIMAQAPDGKGSFTATLSNFGFSTGNGEWAANTSPIGIGTSKREIVTSAGNYPFAGTDLEMAFAGTLPNAPIVVTKLAGKAPSKQPTGQPFTYEDAYWIVRNYGTNSGLSVQMTFKTAPIQFQPTSEPKIFKRASGAIGAWQFLSLGNGGLSSASVVSAATGQVRVGGISSFSQFVVSGNEPDPVPVLFSAFSAQRQSPTSALLTWQVESDPKEVAYTILKSLDGTNFGQIGTVVGKQNSFIDSKAATAAYYKVRQTDNDGQFDETPVRYVPLGKAVAGQDIRLYPNPAKGYVYISSQEPLPASIAIHALDGRQLGTMGRIATDGNTYRYALPRVAKGLYRIAAGPKMLLLEIE